jgi:hypothetical protein
MSVVNGYNLRRFDTIFKTSDNIAPVNNDNQKYYRVRKTWEDSKSQVGAYTVLDNAKKEADKRPGYYVFDSDGKLVYPIVNNKQETKLELGDKIKLLTNEYYNGKKIPSWVQRATLYYRGEDVHGWKFSTKKSGAVTGVVKTGMLVKI